MDIEQYILGICSFNRSEFEFINKSAIGNQKGLRVGGSENSEEAELYSAKLLEYPVSSFFSLIHQNFTTSIAFYVFLSSIY